MNPSLNSTPETSKPNADGFSFAKSLVAEELTSVETLMHAYLQGSVPLIQTVCEHIMGAGGKRLRPLVTLLAASAIGYQGEAHIKAAAISEFIHTATLLHDDVVDRSLLRRGQPTVNQQWGNEISVLVGDLVYSRTFQLMTELRNFDVMGLLAQSTRLMAEGELKQLQNRGEPLVTPNDCLEVIAYKTAKLFEVSASLAGIINDSGDEHCQALAAYGHNLGMAFQIVDDLLDYTGDVEATGKKLGEDLVEGKPTMPLICAIEQSEPAESKWLKSIIANGGTDDIQSVLVIVQNSGALQTVGEMALAYAQKASQALEKLPSSVYLKGLRRLIDFAVSRAY